MNKLVFILFLTSFFNSSTYAATSEDLNKTVTNFGLLDSTGEYHELHRNKTAKAIVIISHATGCPIVRRLVPSINRLKDKYGPRGVRFFFLNAKSTDRKNIEKEVKDYSIEIPMLMDESQLVSKLLNFTRTGEAVIIDPKTWKISYVGSVTNAFKYESQTKGTPFLANALDAFLAKRKIPIPTEVVMGCAISYIKQPTSYSKDIAPILINKCIFCHSQHGGMTPTDWTDYKSVANWSAMIREVVLNMRMPPWTLDYKFGHFKDTNTLEPHEAQALVTWIDQGSPRGEGPDPIEKLKNMNTPKEWAMGKPDLLLTMPEPQKVPAEGVLSYRYVQIGGPTKEDLWVKGIHIKSDNRNVVHHTAVHVLPKKVEEYPNGASYKDGMLLNFDRELSLVHLSGKYGEPIEFPKGSAKFIPKGSNIYLEIHYLPSGRAESDNTKVGLYTYKSKPKKSIGRYIFANLDFKIPPKESNFKLEMSKVTEEVELIGLFAHMHYRGKSASFVATYPDGEKEILLSIPKYNYNWHRFYMLEEPKKMPKGTKITMYITYDNSSENPDNPDPTKTVVNGALDTHEMAFGIALYTEPTSTKSK